jgi:hypothetical protein
MTIQGGVRENTANLKLSICGLLACLSPALAPAAELYNLDFTPPDSGVYQVTAGNPTVQSTAGTLTDALVFHAVSGGEQIRLPIGVPAPQYRLQCDVLAQNLANSDYSFGVYFGTAAASTVSFSGGVNSIYVYQSSPFVNISLASLTNDSVYHLEVTLDSLNSLGSVAINGASLFSGPLGGAALQDIRFGLAPWIVGAANAPNTDVALDNVIVSAVPEPTAAALAAAAALLWLTFQRNHLQSGR